MNKRMNVKGEGFSNSTYQYQFVTFALVASVCDL